MFCYKRVVTIEMETANLHGGAAFCTKPWPFFVPGGD